MNQDDLKRMAAEAAIDYVDGGIIASVPAQPSTTSLTRWQL